MKDFYNHFNDIEEEEINEKDLELRNKNSKDVVENNNQGLVSKASKIRI